MPIHEKYIVVPFRKGRGQSIMTGEMRLANSEAHAARMAETLASYHVGAAAIAVLVDDDIGEMSSPRLIVEFGQAVDLIANTAAA